MFDTHAHLSVYRCVIRGSVGPVCGDAVWNIDAAVPDKWCTKTAEGRTWHRYFAFSAVSQYFTQSWREGEQKDEREKMNVGLRGKENIQPEFESHLFKYMIYDTEIFLVFPRKM